MVTARALSLAAQTQKVRGYCALYDLELVELIEDPGASAKTLERPGLKRALAALDRGDAEGLVVNGEGQFGPIEMGGMFTVVKIRDGISSYEDPGPYKFPPGSVAKKISG